MRHESAGTSGNLQLAPAGSSATRTKVGVEAPWTIVRVARDPHRTSQKRELLSMRRGSITSQLAVALIRLSRCARKGLVLSKGLLGAGSIRANLRVFPALR
jgi:hypothetical protein